MSRAERAFSGTDLRQVLARKRPDLLAYTNASAAYIPALGALRGFHVVRDPRDLIVSAYFSHLHSHRVDIFSELREHRPRLQAVSKREGLLLEMEFSRPFLENIYTWDYTQPNILEVRMENLIQAPYECMAEIMVFLGLVDPPDEMISYRNQLATLLMAGIARLDRAGRALVRGRFSSSPRREPPSAVAQADSSPRGTYAGNRAIRDRLALLRLKRRQLDMANLLLIVYRHRFANLADGRSPGQEDQHSHYRKGVAGDWVNHFEPVHIEYFKRNFNDVLLKLGYVETPDWH